MIILFILFLLFAVSILFSGHYVIYATLVRFFNIADIKSKQTLVILLAFLAISFIAASLIARFNQSIFSRYFYFFSSVWLGLVNYLLIACALCWLLLLIAEYAGINLNLKFTALFLFGLAIAITAYGLWNAQRPIIKFINVKINNLPPYWQGKQVIQLSDVHLGLINNKNFIEKIIKQVNSIQYEALFITGDYFDGTDGVFENLISPLGRTNPPLGRFFVAGNHETYIQKKNLLDEMESAGVKILNDEKTNINGLQIVGLGFPEYAEKRADAALALDKFDFTLPSILLFHSPTIAAEAKKHGVDLLLTGHTHCGQFFPINLISRLVYGRNYCGLHTDGDFNIYTSSGAGTWGPPLRVGNQPEIAVIKLTK